MDNLTEIIVGGGVIAAVTSLLQFFFTRRWAVKDRQNEVVEMIKKIDEKLDAHIEADELATVKQARIRIIRLADELRNGHDASDEYIENAMDDIDVYETYCETHPQFPNSKAKLSIEIVKRAYSDPRKD